MEYKSLLNSNPLLALLDAVKILWSFPKIIVIFVVIRGFHKVFIGLLPRGPLAALSNLTISIFLWAFLLGGFIAVIDRLKDIGISWKLLWQEGWNNFFSILPGWTLTFFIYTQLTVAIMGIWVGVFIGPFPLWARIPTGVLGSVSYMLFQFYAAIIVLEGKSFVESLKGSARLVFENLGSIFCFTVIYVFLRHASAFPTFTFGLPSAILPSMIHKLIHTLWASIGTAITWTYYVLYYKKLIV